MKRLKYVFRSALGWVLGSIIMLPLLMTLAGSLMHKTELMEYIAPVLSGGTGFASAPLFPAMPTLVQYASLLLDTPKFLTMFWNSVCLVVPVVLGQALVGTMAAWAFARYRFPFREGLFLLYIALMMMPFQVMLVPSFLSLRRLDLLDTRWAVILPGVFSTFSVFLLRQFFLTVPDSLVESARIDGAGEGCIFLKIGVPLGLPGIASLCILTALDYWNQIEQPMTFLRDAELWPLSLYLTRIGESNIEVAMAASILTLLPTLLLFLYLQNYLIQGIQMSGIKE